MKKKMQSEVYVENDLLVDLTFHNVPASLLKEFALQVVRPYYSGSLSEALRDLMQKAVTEQEFVQRHISINQK
ncbi:hypothetical protein MUP38_08760 [Candidatus Bathyarchaeota archaeon]|nr:hypothetical protein [Candidatus Bathyarchaeota archaeon]